MTHALGRRVPPDWQHVDKYPLTRSMVDALSKPTPVVAGVNWYQAFDRPERDSAGHYWIGRSGQLGNVRGGHCFALKPRGVRDNTAWWDFYDQGSEGACVGFGVSRAMTLLNRRRYFARWVWDRAKSRDQWSNTNPGDDEGTSVRAGLEVARDEGLISWRASLAELDDEQVDAFQRVLLKGTREEGISAYRWIRSIDDLATVLGYGGLGYVDLINSWGRSWPHLTRVPLEVVDRLWREDGEFGVPVDK